MTAMRGVGGARKPKGHTPLGSAPSTPLKGGHLLNPRLVYELVALLEDFAASPRVVGCTEEFLRRSVALGHEPSRLVRVPDLARGVREIAQARGGRPRRPADRISP